MKKIDDYRDLIISQLISRINQELTVCEEMLGYFPFVDVYR